MLTLMEYAATHVFNAITKKIVTVKPHGVASILITEEHVRIPGTILSH